MQRERRKLAFPEIQKEFTSGWMSKTRAATTWWQDLRGPTATIFAP